MADMTWTQWTLSANIEISATKFFFLSSFEVELKHNCRVFYWLIKPQLAASFL